MVTVHWCLLGFHPTTPAEPSIQGTHLQDTAFSGWCVDPSAIGREENDVDGENVRSKSKWHTHLVAGCWEGVVWNWGSQNFAHGWSLWWGQSNKKLEQWFGKYLSGAMRGEIYGIMVQLTLFGMKIQKQQKPSKTSCFEDCSKIPRDNGRMHVHKTRPNPSWNLSGPATDDAQCPATGS